MSVRQKHGKESKNGKIFSVDSGVELLQPFTWELLAFDRIIRKAKARFKTLKKRKWFYLCELYAVEQSKGYFSRGDLALIMGHDDRVQRIENYWSKLLRENWIVELRSERKLAETASPKPRAVTTSFFLSVSSSLVHGLGDYLDPDGIHYQNPCLFRFDGGHLRAVRQDIGMSIETLADKLGVQTLTAVKYELQSIPIPIETSRKLIKLFYFKINPRFWTDEVKSGINSGALPWPHFERLKETNLFPSRTSWDEFQAHDRPRIFKAQQRRAEAEQVKTETIKQISAKQQGKFSRNDFFAEDSQ